ncbi:MAG: metallophosphoesterase [Eubacterium sp.]|nr:metallophosphoesterase [Eubacterium sp.]
MSTYVMSDIHGSYDKFIRMLEKIDFKDEDTLYIIGDVLDRGPNPIKTLLKIMEMPNIIPIIGNHELMALECLEFLCKEITEESIKNVDRNIINNISNWEYNGSETTLKEFYTLDDDTKKEVVEFIKDFSIYEDITVKCNDGVSRRFLLVHAGLGNYNPDKDIYDYSLYELTWMRGDYFIHYYPKRKNFFVISGHTPTQLINTNPNPGFIYREANQISIDCGACFENGRLAAIRLETDEEFYVDDSDI